MFAQVSLPSNRNKSKTKQNGLINFTSFCTAKETMNKMKRRPSGWEKIFANDGTYKGLIFKIYKQPIQLDNKKPTPQSKNGQKT